MRRYGIFLKKQMCSPGYWGQLVLLILLYVTIATIQPPTAQNARVGVCVEEVNSSWVFPELEKRTGEIGFVPFFDEKELYEAVISAKIDSGFVFPERWEEQKKIIFLCSPFTTKGELAKEAVFTACFPTLSEHFLLQEDERIYGTPDAKRQQYLLERNRLYLNGGELLELQVQTLSHKGEVSVGENLWGYHVFLWCLCGLILFLQKGGLKNRVFEGASFWKWRLPYDLATYTLPVIVSLFCLWGSQKGWRLWVELISFVTLFLMMEFLTASGRRARRFWERNIRERIRKL